MSQGLGGRSYCPLLERRGHVTALADTERQSHWRACARQKQSDVRPARTRL